MRTKMLLVILGVIGLCSGCRCSGLPSERVLAINAEWYRVYTADRRPTADEAAAFAALDDTGKEAWKAEGKPYEGPLSERLVEAAMDIKEGVDAEANAAK